MQSFPQNLQQNMLQTPTKLGRSSTMQLEKSSEPVDQAVPAGRPSYVKEDSEEETRVRSKSPNKWRIDNSIYEPKQAKYKINRQNTDEINKANEAKEFGVRYPKWWGDNSEEKRNKKTEINDQLEVN